MTEQTELLVGRMFSILRYASNLVSLRCELEKTRRCWDNCITNGIPNPCEARLNHEIVVNEILLRRTLASLRRDAALN